MVLVAFAYPSYRVPSSKTTIQELREVDWVGIVLHAGSFVLFGLATLFSGPTWAWNSGSAIATWVVFGVVLIAYVAQQSLSLFVPPERRAFPVSVLKYRAIIMTWICTCCVAVTYGVTLYYTPVYFAFSSGRAPLSAAVRLLPFIGPMVFMLFFSGGLLPAVRVYMPFFVFSGVLLVVGSGVYQTIDADTPDRNYMGFEAILGAGVGAIWQLAPAVASRILDAREVLDQAALQNLAHYGGAIGLCIAGAVYENVGYHVLRDAVGGRGQSAAQIRQLLAGADAPLVLAAGDPAVRAAAVAALTDVLMRLFYIPLAAGAVCVVAACGLRPEALHFRTPAPASKGSVAESREEPAREGEA